MFKNFKMNPIIFKYAAFVIIALSIIIGFVTRIYSVNSYINFINGDPVRDAFVYQDMKAGDIQMYGAIAPIHGSEFTGDMYFLPPLYYYIVYPFTLLGDDPIIQVIPNIIFSFLSIPLIIYFVYKFLTNTEKDKRLLLSAIAGFFWSLFIYDILLAGMHWNPSPIPFFLMGLILILKQIFENNNSTKKLVLLWGLVGIIVALMVSFHSITLFTIPVLVALNSIYLVYKNRSNKLYFLYPAMALVIALTCLIPYWVGEVNSNFQNSLNIVSGFSRLSNEQVIPLLSRIDTIFDNYFQLIQKGYFINEKLDRVAIFFGSIALGFGLYKFRGDRFILTQIIIHSLIYSLGVMNFSGEIDKRYQIVIWFLPLITSLSVLAYTKFDKFKNYILITFISAGIFSSIFFNLFYGFNNLARKFGPNRMVNSNDMQSILEAIPSGSSVCYEKPERQIDDLGYSLAYINRYVVEKEQIITQDCASADYFVYLKNLLVHARESRKYLTKQNTNSVDPTYQKLKEEESYILYKIPR